MELKKELSIIKRAYTKEEELKITVSAIRVYKLLIAKNGQKAQLSQDPVQFTELLVQQLYNTLPFINPVIIPPEGQFYISAEKSLTGAKLVENALNQLVKRSNLTEEEASSELGDSWTLYVSPSDRILMIGIMLGLVTLQYQVNKKIPEDSFVREGFPFKVKKEEFKQILKNSDDITKELTKPLRISAGLKGLLDEILTKQSGEDTYRNLFSRATLPVEVEVMLEEVEYVVTGYQFPGKEGEVIPLITLKTGEPKVDELISEWEKIPEKERANVIFSVNNVIRPITIVNFVEGLGGIISHVK